jgi:hypothetical protein
MFKEYRLELAVVTAVCCVYNLYTANIILAVVCGVAAVGNYLCYKVGK